MLVGIREIFMGANQWMRPERSFTTPEVRGSNRDLLNFIWKFFMISELKRRKWTKRSMMMNRRVLKRSLGKGELWIKHKMFVQYWPNRKLFSMTLESNNEAFSKASWVNLQKFQFANLLKYKQNQIRTLLLRFANRHVCKLMNSRDLVKRRVKRINGLIIVNRFTALVPVDLLHHITGEGIQ